MGAKKPIKISKKIPQFMGVREYARYRDCAHTSVQDAIRDGRLISFTKDGRKYAIDVVKADKEWKDNTFEGNARTKTGEATIAVDASDSSTSSDAQKAEEDAGPSYKIARAKREDLQAQMLQMEFELKSGRLIRADEVELKAFEDGRKVKSAVMNLPDRLAPLLAAESDVVKIHTILMKECASLLKGLAREIREGE